TQSAGAARAVALGRARGGRRRRRSAGGEGDGRRTSTCELGNEWLAILAELPEDGGAHASAAATELHGIVQHGDGGRRRGRRGFGCFTRDRLGAGELESARR